MNCANSRTALFIASGHGQRKTEEPDMGQGNETTRQMKIKSKRVVSNSQKNIRGMKQADKIKIRNKEQGHRLTRTFFFNASSHSSTAQFSMRASK